MAYENIINKLNRDLNIGSVQRIFFIDVKDITSGLPHLLLDPQTLNNVFYVDFMVIGNDGTWYESEKMVDEAEWTQDMDNTPNGVIYKDKISFFVSKDYARRRKLFAGMEYQQFAVFVADNNNKGTFFGYRTIEGTKHGMTMTFKKTTGRKRTALNYYTIDFYMEAFGQPYPATYTYEIEVPAPPVDGGGGTIPDDVPEEA